MQQMQMMPFLFMGGCIADVPASAKGLVQESVCGHSAVMTREIVNHHCAALPGATVSDPWGGGHDAWKVGGKMFACVGAMPDHGVAVKCADVETAALLIDLGRALRAPYFHASWVRLPWGSVPEAELRDRLTDSYRIIRAALPRKVQASLSPLA
jgi:predicted DNA-binding protein (MmcQ/YjbR family)